MQINELHYAQSDNIVYIHRSFLVLKIIAGMNNLQTENNLSQVHGYIWLVNRGLLHGYINLICGLAQLFTTFRFIAGAAVVKANGISL